MGPRRRARAAVKVEVPDRELLCGRRPRGAVGRARDGPAHSAAAGIGKYHCRPQKRRRPRRRSLALSRIELWFLPGECVGVLGRNGVGKTTLLELCLGRRDPDEGSVTIGKRTQFNYIDQGRVDLDESKSVLDEIKTRRKSSSLAISRSRPGAIFAGSFLRTTGSTIVSAISPGVSAAASCSPRCSSAEEIFWSSTNRPTIST